MADREIVNQRDQTNVENMDVPEVVTGAGRVGIIAAAYETRQQRVFIAEQGSGTGAGSSDAAPVTRDEAVRGMQSLEQRAAQAIAGTAEQTAQAMNRLAGQTTAAVQHTAESSQHAVTTLEDQTREAFGRTKTALGSV